MHIFQIFASLCDIQGTYSSATVLMSATEKVGEVLDSSVSCDSVGMSHPV